MLPFIRIQIMKLTIIQVGKTEEKYLRDGLSEYYSRIRKYVPLEVVTVAQAGNKRNKPVQLIKTEEAAVIEKNFRGGDIIVMLDEKGEQLRSRDFAAYLQKNMNTGPKRILFIIGGPWGLDENIKQKADTILAVSSMTFSHQLVRLLFAEQLYRALTIIRGIPYHND